MTPDDWKLVKDLAAVVVVWAIGVTAVMFGGAQIIKAFQ